MTPAEKLQTILNTHHLYRMPTSCPQCGYDIFSRWSTEQQGIDMDACVFCYPPKGFHRYGDHLYEVHPRPRSHH